MKKSLVAGGFLLGALAMTGCAAIDGASTSYGVNTANNRVANAYAGGDPAAQHAYIGVAQHQMAAEAQAEGNRHEAVADRIDEAQGTVSTVHNTVNMLRSFHGFSW